MGVNMKMIQQMQTRLETMQRELAETVVEERPAVASSLPR